MTCGCTQKKSPDPMLLLNPEEKGYQTQPYWRLVFWLHIIARQMIHPMYLLIIVHVKTYENLVELNQEWLYTIITRLCL